MGSRKSIARQSIRSESARRTIFCVSLISLSEKSEKTLQIHTSGRGFHTSRPRNVEYSTDFLV